MMSPSWKKTPATLKMVVALLALLTLLAILQYRWLGQVSQAERDRMRANLRSATSHFAHDFDREIARAFVYFRVSPMTSPAAREDYLVERYRLWQEEAPYPLLVDNLFLAREDEAGGYPLARLDPATHRFQLVGGTELGRLRKRFENPFVLRPRPRGPMPFFVIEEVPALVIPLSFEPSSSGPLGSGRRPRRGRILEAAGPPDGLVIVELHLSLIQQELLPELAERYFGTGVGLDYDLVVFREGDPQPPVFQSNPESYFETGDATIRLFGPVPFQELRHLWLEAEFGLPASIPPDGGPGPPPSAGPRPPYPDAPGDHDGLGLWRLVVRHRTGSLETAVSTARLRNLLVSLGILGVLAVSVAMIVLSTQRAQQLARQQMEFVAGVTHELQTPLAVIRSAGQNLADGVVEAKKQVREYGSLIEKEGLRLSGMVDQVLEFAGLQSGRRNHRAESVRVQDTIESALADCEPAISQKGIRVEKKMDADLPTILADPSSLRRALQNLLDNAIKYGADGKWIGIRARRNVTGGKEEIVLTVEDRGPGILAADLPHVFEPFYRGATVQSGPERGSGLGLSLVRQIVEAHGGGVSVHSQAGQGTVFTIRLPGAREEPREERR